ncbi:membrane protein [Streptomyces chrestomyceticus JCM 4735]|uniref:Membrane protein n=1 Tax=Streptomyces chrestomyceticus JCM 4735 TaxID=1306181 RepID=A0A7U9Q189_9ACTN|nr:hypothetical protein [Streptomyces chrestomyceticus]GCD36129.1 membrane protein [Streptomyces chrestomyceticus JCM 4735]
MPGTDSLRTEVDAAFAHALGQALDSPELGEALRRTPGAADREQLRTRAHRERDTLCAAAAPEYETYARLRSANAAPPPDAESRTAADSGGGLLPALGVLVPSLGAVAAVLFLAIGFGMRLVGFHRQFADELVYAGWLAAGIAAAATVAGLAWMLVTAARNRSADGAPGADAATGDLDPEVAQARAAWQRALLERGILPFLLNHIRTQEETHTTPPAAPTPRTRPGYSAPEYGSPEYASPEYASPGYGRPAYGSPAYESPDR